MKTPLIPPKPKFIVDASGKKSSVVLSIEEYENLLDAWEEVADAEDFAEGKRSAGEFLTPADLRREVLGEE